MRPLALAVAAALVFAVISPAFAQPFADTPPNHWAYDAIAVLAAKGLIEGYPDGTFKGDRAMTRYEMAMVVARLLARIESIQIPSPGPQEPMVTKEDIDTIMKLVDEFRAELAAKNVRLTAVEEELNAIKARLDNVRITGAAEFRYQWDQAASGPPLPGNNNPKTGAISAGGNAWLPQATYAFKLQFDGSVVPDLHAIVGIITYNGSAGKDNAFIAFNSGAYGSSSSATFETIDTAFLDWTNVANLPLEVWLGRFGGQSPGPTYPVQFGPFGLLLNTAGDTWEDSTADSGSNSVDGLYVNFHDQQALDLIIQGIYTRVDGLNGQLTWASGQDAFGLDASAKILDGLRIGGYYVGDSVNTTAGSFGPAPLGPDYNLYGPGGGSHNPTTAHCPVGPNGIQCPAAGNGYGFYADWKITPGISFAGEWAQWADTVLGGSDNGYNAVVTWDLGTLLGIGRSLVVTTGYQYSGVNFYPPVGAAELDIFGWDYMYPGNAQGLTVTASFDPVEKLNLYVDFVTGNNVSNGQSILEWQVGLHIALAPNTGFLIYWRDLAIAGVDQKNRYRAQLTYTF